MADNMFVVPPRHGGGNIPEFARGLVFEHIRHRFEKTDIAPDFKLEDVYIVWFAFTLGNWKALVSTTLPNGQYYEVTHNREQSATYIDTYVKTDNVEIPHV